MADTTQRLLRLLALMASRTDWPGPELARRLGVTDRTVRRDVERLRELGYPVEARQGVGGGYRLGAGRRLPPLLLDDDEAVAVVIGLRLGATGGVADIGEAAVRTLTKLDQVMPARLRPQVAAVDEATVLFPGAGGGPAVSPETLVLLAGATREHLRVRFGYEARTGQQSDRDVEPYRLVTTGRRWYLLAWDLGRDDWRTFRLDRMRGARATTFRFRPRQAPDAAAYVQQSVTRSGYAIQAVVVFGTPAERLRERIPPTIGTVRELGPERCELSAGAERTRDLAWHLGWIACDLDCSLEVVDPPQLAEAFTELGSRFAALGHASGRTTPC